MMNFTLYKKIIDDLSDLLGPDKQLATLHLYKDGEPFLNDKLFEMANYARKMNVARIIQTTTNGSFLLDRLDELIKSKFDMIRISVEHIHRDGYHRITKKDNAFDKVRSGIACLYKEKSKHNPALKVVVKINDTALNTEEKEQFHAMFGEISDETRIDTLMGWSYSEIKDFTLGIKVDKGMDSVTPLKEKVICPEPFHSLAVNPTGSVSVCCVDWSYKTIVGNTTAQTLREIWEGKELRHFRYLHIRNRRKEIAPCAHCQFLSGFSEINNLDRYEQRLSRMYDFKE